VDHRSYERQGVDREPGLHIGPTAAYQVERGQTPDRLARAVDAVDVRDRLVAVDQEIARIETERGGLAHQVERFEQVARSKDLSGGSGGPGRDDDSSPGR